MGEIVMKMAARLGVCVTLLAITVCFAADNSCIERSDDRFTAFELCPVLGESGSADDFGEIATPSALKVEHQQYSRQIELLQRKVVRLQRENEHLQGGGVVVGEGSKPEPMHPVAYLAELVEQQKRCPKPVAAAPAKLETPRYSYQEYDAAILGLTHCEGNQIRPKTNKYQNFVLKGDFWYDQKSYRQKASGHWHSTPQPCAHPNTKSVTIICPEAQRTGSFRTWRNDVKLGMGLPSTHANGWDYLKDSKYCKAVIGRKSERDAAVRAKTFKGWGYGKVDGIWYEIYSFFKCGVRSKITVCEASKGKCQVRKNCDECFDVKLKEVWAVPNYPEMRGNYRKYGSRHNKGVRWKRMNPKSFMDKLLSMKHGGLSAYFRDRCQSRCAWY